MPPRTRASAAAADRVYSSTPFRRQVTFRARKQQIRSRPSSQNIKRARQQTLTQIDFVNIHSHVEDDEEGLYEQETPRKSKRRKTEGDTPSSISKYYTQTLTQLHCFSTPASTFDSVNDAFADVSCQPLISTKATADGLWSPHKKSLFREQSSRFIEACLPAISMAPPATPNRKRVTEIPSSQSPATPLSVQSRTISEYRSPLKSMSANSQCAPRGSESPVLIRSTLKRCRLEIQDSFDSDVVESPERGWLPQRKKSTASKAVNFAPGLEASNCGLASNAVEIDIQQGHISNATEIEDSDAESDEDPDTCYEDLGPETQIEAGAIISTFESQLPDSMCSNSEQGRTISHAVSQYSQTQRLSNQQFDLMVPRSDKSDIIISIHPQHVANIVSRAKDHEFRTWPVPDQVTRVWIYETKPTSAIKYMASMGAAKLPGEIINEAGVGNADFNVGRKMGAYAYEILQLYELADPVSLETAKTNDWLKGPPQKYVYVRPAMLDHLMASLRMPLFSQTQRQSLSLNGTDSQETEEQLRSTMLQYSQMPLKERILSSDVGSPTAKCWQASDAPSTKEQSYCNALRKSIARPSQATTVDLTQPASSYAGHPEVGRNDEILWGRRPDNDGVVSNSPIRQALPSLSSSPLFPAVLQSSDCRETPVPYSLPSSQLMTKSQMPESLLLDSMPPPPLLVDELDLDE